MPEEIIEEQPKTGLLEKLKIHKFKILGGILGVFVFAGAVFGAYKFGQKQVLPGPKPTPTPVVEATPTPDPTANWKTYMNTKTYKYQIKYPVFWTPLPHEGPAGYDEGVTFVPPAGTIEERISLNCPRGAGKSKTELPNPHEWVPNEGGFVPLYVKYADFGGMKGIQYVWGAPYEIKRGNTGAWLHTAVLREPELLVCELTTWLNLEGKEGIEDPTTFNYEKLISELSTFSLMLSTFKFLE